jgi:FAD/FMN-containing dehydrogenase
MSVAEVLAEGDSPVTDADVARLRAAVRGTVYERSSLGYDDARVLFNAAVGHRPGAIVAVTGASDVAATLAITRHRGLSVSVRGGGHAVAGRATAGDIVLDLSALRGVLVDADARTATVRGGTLWGEFDAAAAAYGLATPGGRVGSTGVAGLTLGGGEGWLSRRHGLASDNLLAAEIVTAEGRRVVVSSVREADLFWALRGAGANFGVVTSLTFRLHPVDPDLLGGMLLFRIADAQAVLGTLAELHDAGDGAFAGAAAIMCAPAAAFVPGHVVGRTVLAVVPAFTADAVRGRPFVSRLCSVARPLAASVRPMSYLELQAVFEATAPAGLRRAWSATQVPALTPALVDDLESAGLPSPQSKIILLRFGGAVTRPDADTAVAYRQESWLIHPAAQWPSAADDARHRAWVSDLDARLRSAGPAGTYLNLTDDSESRVRAAYEPAVYRRLAALKAVWDPDDLFRHCAHIPPAPSGASA